VYSASSAYVDPILFLVVLGALLLQRRRGSTRAEDAQTSTWQTAKTVRPIPRELVNVREVLIARRALPIVLGGFALVLPLVLSESRTNLAALILIFAIIGLSLVVLTGWAGQVSLGQIGFVAIGAAVGGACTNRLHWDMAIALLAAGLAGAFAAVVIGLPALRIRGLFLAVTTLAFAMAVSSYGLNPAYIHWLPTGRIQRTPLLGRIAVDTEVRYYYLCLAGLVLSISMLQGIRRSHIGRAFIGVRDNERAAQAFAVSAVGAKLTAFAFSGFLAAFAGGLFVHHQQSLGISPYLPEQSLKVFVMVVIGGVGSISGALVGALYLQGLTYFASDLPAGIRELVTFMSTGLGVVFVLLFLPGGLGSVVYSVRDRGLRWVAARRGIHVPSLVADSARPEEPTVLTGRDG
jgi:branched-chain amino acid transport system permease protein